MRQWAVITALITVLFSVLFAFPNYFDEPHIHGCRAFWEAFDQQTSHPLTPREGFAPASHEAKQTFRLVLPVIGKITGLSARALVALQHLCALLFFTLIARLVASLTQDRVAAFFFTFALGQTYVGSSFFYDLLGTFDGYAILWLLMAMYMRHPLSVGLFSLLAIWTDERAAVATLLVALWWWVQAGRLDRHVVAVVSAVVLSLGARALLQHHYGLSLPVGDDAGVGLAVVRKNFAVLPVGLFSGIEYTWILVGLALFGFVLKRQWFYTSVFAGGSALLSLIALSVHDLTRSAIYVFPATLIAIWLVAQELEQKRLRALMFGIACGCLIHCNQYVMSGEPAWISPILPKILKYF